MRRAAVLALLCASCVPLEREDGTLEVFVAGEDALSVEVLEIEIRDGGKTLATSRESAASFPGSFRFASAPAGSYSAKVRAFTGADVTLEAPAAGVAITNGVTTGVWVRVNERPFEDDDGDLVRNGDDACPQFAGDAGADSDGDGSFDACDVCPEVSNPSQADADADGTGDACETIAPGEFVHYAPVGDLFASRCALTGCHAALAPQENMTLTAAAGYGQTVNVPSSQQPGLDRIEPGDLAGSYLFRKVDGGVISGSTMPPAPLTPLSGSERDLIERWILDGALP